MAEKSGPWTYLLHGYRGGPDDEPYGLTDADARIADASKEMLAALERTLRYAMMFANEARDLPQDADDFDEVPWVQQARAAIAKAKGKGYV